MVTTLALSWFIGLMMVLLGRFPWTCCESCWVICPSWTSKLLIEVAVFLISFLVYSLNWAFWESIFKSLPPSLHFSIEMFANFVDQVLDNSWVVVKESDIMLVLALNAPFVIFPGKVCMIHLSSIVCFWVGIVMLRKNYFFHLG